MFAVIKTGGKQYKVQEGDILDIEKIGMEKGKKVTFDQVLLVESDGKTMIGTPYVENAVVSAVIIENFKGDKVLVFKKKRRKQYRRTRGHRQDLTRVKIEKIEVGGKKEKGEAIKTAEKAAPKAPAAIKPAAKAVAEKKPAAAKKPAGKSPAAKKAAKPAAGDKAVSPTKGTKKASPAKKTSASEAKAAKPKSAAKTDADKDKKE